MVFYVGLIDSFDRKYKVIIAHSGPSDKELQYLDLHFVCAWSTDETARLKLTFYRRGGWTTRSTLMALSSQRTLFFVSMSGIAQKMVNGSGSTISVPRAGPY